MAGADHCDAFVIGGGPAGATTARLLASWGWSVILAHHTPAARISLAESLPPSSRKLLAFLHLLDAVESGRFHPNRGNAGVWAGLDCQTQTAPDGFHVPRARFDALLRREAAAAGAPIVDAVVQRVAFGDPHRIEYASGARRTACTARMILDCSGRAGVVARRGLRRTNAQYRTIAIAADWECPEWPEDERTRTVIESYRDGWAWSVPLSSTRRQCTVMIDPASVARHRRAADHSALPQAYAREIACAHRIGRRLASATQVSAPSACDASVYDAERAADSGVVLVGDAASFIEPLSSAGVQKAMTSAWRAAVVANTCLRRAGMTSAALDFYVRREREVYGECQQVAGKFFREAADCHASAFWSTRAQPMDAPSAGEPSGVQHAFDRLRTSPRLNLRLASALRFAEVADIEGREVVLKEAVVMPDDGQTLRFAAGVNLAALARLAPSCDEVPALFSAYTTRIGPVPMDGLLTGLSLLVARQALIHEDARS
jgi:flavin-dependent dehydrogenase